jgi:hypothetical protein
VKSPAPGRKDREVIEELVRGWGRANASWRLMYNIASLSPNFPKAGFSPASHNSRFVRVASSLVWPRCFLNCSGG